MTLVLSRGHYQLVSYRSSRIRRQLSCKKYRRFWGLFFFIVDVFI